MVEDPYNLQRFVTAQGSLYATALRELQDGYKRSHWMWFIFPQLRGLGFSSTAQFYGLTGLDEARAYLDHETLGPRLLDCTQAAVNAQAASVRSLFGSPDDLKFRSSMTLFDLVSPDGIFRHALDRWCDGQPDERTLSLQSAAAPAA